MKLIKNTKKVKIEAGYIFANGHAVVVYSEYHERSKSEVKFVEVYQQFCHIHGLAQSERLVIHNGGLLRAIQESNYIEFFDKNRATSPATKEKGFEVETLAITNDAGYFTVNNIKSLISSCFSVNDETDNFGQTFTEIVNNVHNKWSDYYIAKVYKAEECKQD
jgi:hypothetical protein